jgi:hypothetical protein
MKKREGKLREFARAIRATIINPSDASASTLLASAVRWSNSTGEIGRYRGVSIYGPLVNQYSACTQGESRELSAIRLYRGGCGFNDRAKEQYSVIAVAAIILTGDENASLWWQQKMTIVGDRRFIRDRRTTNKPWIYSRRVRPDRRLNSIIVEWVPNNEVLLQPSLFKAYIKTKTRK